MLADAAIGAAGLAPAAGHAPGTSGGGSRIGSEPGSPTRWRRRMAVDVSPRRSPLGQQAGVGASGGGGAAGGGRRTAANGSARLAVSRSGSITVPGAANTSGLGMLSIIHRMRGSTAPLRRLRRLRGDDASPGAPGAASADSSAFSAATALPTEAGSSSFLSSFWVSPSWVGSFTAQAAATASANSSFPAAAGQRSSVSASGAPRPQPSRTGQAPGGGSFAAGRPGVGGGQGSDTLLLQPPAVSSLDFVDRFHQLRQSVGGSQAGVFACLPVLEPHVSGWGEGWAAPQGGGGGVNT